MFQNRKTNNSSKPTRNDRGCHPEGTRAQALRREPYPFNASVKSPKDLSTQSHVITRNNVEQKGQKSIQSDVVIHNKLGNGEACKGLLRRFVHKISNNNEISPHNDMNNKNDNKLINLFTHRLIDVKKILRLKPQNDVINKNVTNLMPSLTSLFPSLSLLE